MKAQTKNTLALMRRNRWWRLGVMGLLLLILVLLYVFWGKFRLWLLGLIIVLMVALGLEVSGTDIDLGKLIESGSLPESMVQQTENGTWLIGDQCNAVNLNCANFKYREEAQLVFEDCGGIGNDVHGLDRDHDGIVCESLPLRPY